jgi:hypothetical protein
MNQTNVDSYVAYSSGLSPFGTLVLIAIIAAAIVGIVIFTRKKQCISN